MNPNIRYRLICATGEHHTPGDRACGPHRLEPMTDNPRSPSILADLAVRATRNAGVATVVDDLLHENGCLRRELAHRATGITDERENLLRALAQAVRSENLTRARSLAQQETLTR